jgi:hypothetical protein
MCRSELKDKLVSLIFKHTSALGMRENTGQRGIVIQDELKEIKI